MQDQDDNPTLPVGTTAVRFDGIRYHIPVWVTGTPKIFPAMIAANRAIESVAKGRKNVQQGYNFRGIDQVYDMIHGVLADAGIVTVPVVLERRTSQHNTKSGGSMTLVEIRVEYWLYAEDGSALVAGPLWAEGLDNSDKGSNKCMSFAQKYMLLQTFTIPTEDVAEGDRETHERAPAQQHMRREDEPEIGVETAAKVLEAFGAIGVTRDQLKAKLGCEVQNAPVSRLDQLKAWKKMCDDDKRNIANVFGPREKTRADALNAQHGATK